MEETDTLDFSNRHYCGQQLLTELQRCLTPYVCRLDLTGNQINEECATFLAEKLSEPGCCIISLCITETRLTVTAASTIFRVIGQSPVIEFYADDLVLKAESLSLLANSISFSSPLEILSLVGNDISSEGFVNLVRCLSETKNLKHLRVGSNSIYETGIRALGESLENSSLTSIDVSDNMIWMGGMTSFLERVMSYPYLTALDISYNAVDLVYLTKVLVANQSITHLAISGCKVNEQSVLQFLEALSKTRLHTLIFDGFNYQVLPTSWPQVKDTTFSKRIHFEAFTSALIASETLEDVRIGYLELEQIFTLEQRLTCETMNKSIKISLNDFGRMHDCWVLNFPAFSVDAPSDTMEWGGNIDTSNAEYMGNLMRHALFNDKMLSKMDLSAMGLTDGVFAKILASLDGITLQLLNINENKLTNSSVTELINYLKNGSINDILMGKNEFTEAAAQQFFRFLATTPSRSPQTLEFQFNNQNDDELREHPCFDDLAGFIQGDTTLRVLKLSGSISPGDVLKLVHALSSNTTLTELEIDSSFIELYRSPDPNIEPSVTEVYFNVANELRSVLKLSSCALRHFKYDLLTEVFIYYKDIIPIWDECLEEMKKKK